MNASRTLAALALAALAGCVQAPSTPFASSVQAAPAPAPATPSAAQDQTAAPPLVLVHKSPTCGCCTKWIEHLRDAGFTVQVDETDELAPIKSRLGVPEQMASCHTAEVAGYFVEGHVPVEDIQRLLAEKPATKGLAGPGMPMGSPGMEGPYTQPYQVMRVDAQGEATVYADHE